MTNQDSGGNCMSAATVPCNSHVPQPTHAVVSGSQEKPSGMTPYLASAAVLQCNTGTPSLQKNPHTVIQNPAAVTGTQSQATGLQHPAGMAGVQTPVVIQYLPGATNIQILPEDPQNPLNTVPGPTQTSAQPQWNMSFISFPQFNPKKFINEEVRTLGAIQILIGLFHIFSAVNPLLYTDVSVLGVSGYQVWGGLSFIISGSLSVWAEKDRSSCVVNGSTGMNVISSIFSLLGIAIIIADLFLAQDGFPTEQKKIVTAGKKAISGSLLPFALLEFILTCTVSHFGCQAVCWPHFENMRMTSTMFASSSTGSTTGPLNTTTIPASATTIPAGATTIPINTAFPSDAPPKLTYQYVADPTRR